MVAACGFGPLTFDVVAYTFAYIDGRRCPGRIAGPAAFSGWHDMVVNGPIARRVADVAAFMDAAIGHAGFVDAARVRAGERTGWTATGGSPISENAESAGSANPTRAPRWARQLRHEQMMRGVERIIREGEAGGAGLKPNLRGEHR